jgi:hypothetical protein
MSTPDLKDAFENELRRVLIQNHPNYPSWYERLTPRAREVVDVIIKEDVTPELIQFSQEVVEEDSGTFQFMFILAGGDPSPNVVLALTNFALGDILQNVRAFEQPQE